MDTNEGPGRDELIHHLGETAYLFTDAGAILITAVTDLDSAELAVLRTLNQPHRCLTVALGRHDLAPAEINLELTANSPLATGVIAVSRFLLETDILVDYVL